jgi:hypothetical protein
MSNQIVAIPRQALAPMPFGEMERLAESIAKSGLFGMKTKEQALTLMAIAQAEGRHPALAARDYDIIQGRPSKKAEAMMRDFLDAGGKIEWHKLDDTTADATFSHQLGGSVRITWDVTRARNAGLGGKDMWKKYPRQMLRSRTVSEGVRTVYPAATSGMYVPEEAADIETRQPIDVTPKATPAAPAPMEITVVASPAIDVETGEVLKPHKLAAEGWIEFGRALIAAVQSAATLDEADEWEHQNRERTDNMRQHTPKIYDRMMAAISKHRTTLVRPEEMIPDDVQLDEIAVVGA